jgi:hypothetical protein
MIPLFYDWKQFHLYRSTFIMFKINIKYNLAVHFFFVYRTGIRIISRVEQPAVIISVLPDPYRYINYNADPAATTLL